MRQGVKRRIDAAQVVEPHHFFQWPGVGQLVEPRPHRPACVVDQHVEPAEPGHGLFHQRAALVGVGYVGRHDQGFRPQRRAALGHARKRSALRAASTSRGRSGARARASASPMPAEAPVMTIDCEAKLCTGDLCRRIQRSAICSCQSPSEQSRAANCGCHCRLVPILFGSAFNQSAQNSKLIIAMRFHCWQASSGTRRTTSGTRRICTAVTRARWAPVIKGRTARHPVKRVCPAARPGAPGRCCNRSGRCAPGSGSCLTCRPRLSSAPGRTRLRC